MKGISLASIGAALVLAGCSDNHLPPSPTAASVLDAQYGARAVHGVMTGPEASAISDQYQKHIGAALDAGHDAPDTETDR